jgi:hypothetical protein
MPYIVKWVCIAYNAFLTDQKILWHTNFYLFGILKDQPKKLFDIKMVELMYKTN